MAVFKNLGTTYDLLRDIGHFSRVAELETTSFRKDNCSFPWTSVLKQARKENACKQILQAFMLLR